LLSLLLELLLELESLPPLLQPESLLPLLQLASLTLLLLQPESLAVLPPDSVVLQLQPLPPLAAALDESSKAELGDDEEVDQKLPPLRRRSSSRQPKGSSSSARSQVTLWKPQRSRQARQRARIDSNIGTPGIVRVDHPPPHAGVE
jgi:hypothetical protein